MAPSFWSIRQTELITSTQLWRVVDYKTQELEILRSLWKKEMTRLSSMPSSTQSFCSSSRNSTIWRSKSISSAQGRVEGLLTCILITTWRGATSWWSIELSSRRCVSRMGPLWIPDPKTTHQSILTSGTLQRLELSLCGHQSGLPVPRRGVEWSSSRRATRTRLTIKRGRSAWSRAWISRAHWTQERI